MSYAEVAVNSPVARSQTFCYRIPASITLEIGQAVWVPFGSRTLQGIVMDLTDIPSFQDTRDIISTISTRPLLSKDRIQLACWLSERYLSPLFDAVAPMLPPGFEQRIETILEAGEYPADMAFITESERRYLNFIAQEGKTSLRTLQKKFGQKTTDRVVRKLVQEHLLNRSEYLREPSVKPKKVEFLALACGREVIAQSLDELRSTRAFKQAEVLEYLMDKGNPVPWDDVRKSLGCSKAIVSALVARGLIAISEIPVRRDPLANMDVAPDIPPLLTPSQERVWIEIYNRMNIQPDDTPPVFLLRGITGSGKTEIYLKALSQVIEHGKKGICLVPEIALTPQTIQRFLARFPGRVAVFHSGLSPGEQYDEWHRISRGECDVVIGPRSALFVPQPELGLIVIDEEHEWTYKQTDQQPHYHAREAAIKLAQLAGATVIMGSATPDVETYFQAREGRYRLLELDERITVRGISPLPEIEVVDLRQELKEGNRSLFSRSLKYDMENALAAGEQIILFLNRRGTSTLVQCKDCGYVFNCPYCLTAFTYHSVSGKLVCHHCRYSKKTPDTCPQCSGSKIRYFGVGTQKVEEETRHLFPGARVIRWDSDITAGKRHYEEIMALFSSHGADILVGTQIIAKGLDIPNVTVVGVINADTGLNLPDFRAAERTFQLACQVAGRAGRGSAEGKVVIQTYNPDNYAIRAAAGHDYLAFYDQEIEYRRQLGYPPFCQLARLLFTNTSEAVCRKETDAMVQSLNREKERKGIPDLRLIGPVPAFVPRLRGKYYRQILLCGHDLPGFIGPFTFSRGWQIDIDPFNVI